MIRQVKIESMAFRGKGVGRIDGKAVFVPFTLIGEVVAVEIIQDKKNYFLGQLREVLLPSPHRIHPPCPYFATCGGCQWQHIDPSIQGELKRKILFETLKRLGKMDSLPPIEVIPLSTPYHYRIRIQLKVKRETIGYHQPESHRIVDITHCMIAHPLVNQLISALREQRNHLPEMEEIEINVSPQEEKGALLFHSHAPDQHLEALCRQLLQREPILKGIAISRRKGWIRQGNPTLLLTIPFPGNKGLSFRISPRSFLQVNLQQNQKLIQKVVEDASPTKNEVVLDLYAGAGNLTLPLALHAGQVWGVEENPAAVEDARYNARANGMPHVHFIKGEVETVLKTWKKAFPDQIILDPPRSGCKTLIDLITGLKPKKIIYVACEPTTFARDLRLFMERGYSLKRLSLIDMFPQTYHIEVVGLLS